MGILKRLFQSEAPNSSLSTTHSLDSYQEIFGSEALRGERIHWKINWVIYAILLCFCIIVYSIQGNVAGLVGLQLSIINLIYNTFLTYFIIVKKTVLHWISYVTMSLNIVSLTVYTFVDAASNSPLITATTAALLLYPIIMFLASLRMDKYLVIYTTVTCILSMNGLYLYFHKGILKTMIESKISADLLSQGYRTAYLIIIGVLIYSVPQSMRRILKKQELLVFESTLHQNKAEHDPLTGLYNRLYFEQQLLHCEQMADTFGYSYALLFIDLNDFKMINDTHGHALGDFVLKSISEDMTKTVRENDLVARYGGDEFVIILKQITERTEIQELASRVEQAIARPRTEQGITLTVHASIGVAVYPDDADSMKHLISRADKAMYIAKKARESNIQFTSENMTEGRGN